VRELDVGLESVLEGVDDEGGTPQPDEEEAEPADTRAERAAHRLVAIAHVRRLLHQPLRQHVQPEQPDRGRIVVVLRARSVGVGWLAGLAHGALGESVRTAR
jgi:hypothetical protein